MKLPIHTGIQFNFQIFFYHKYSPIFKKP